MNDPVPTVFLVDDDDTVRDALSRLIRLAGHAVEAYPDAESFLAGCSPQAHGCAVVDLRMPGMGGLELHRALDRLGLLLPVVFLTGHGDVATSVKAMKDGAVDFLTKPVTGADLMKSIAAALRKSEALREGAQRSASATARLALLTGRERAVMLLAVEGLSNKAIARKLGISYRTVEIHKGSILHKSGAASLLELTRLARDAGLAV